MNHASETIPPYSTVDTILILPTNTSARVVAEDCRDAALMFLNESERWGKAELAMWLMGPYSRIVRASADVPRKSGEHRRPFPLLREIDPRMVDRVIRSARDNVLAVLQQTAHTDGSADFAFEMMSSGHVARCEDCYGTSGWVPTTEPQRLADRVLSLIAVDYLTRPMDYETLLSICPRCGTVDFDEVANMRGECSRHGSGSFFPTHRRVTLPYLPGGA